MLANPEFNWKTQPKIQVWRYHSEDGEGTSVNLESYGPIESIPLFEEASRNNELNYDGKENCSALPTFLFSNGFLKLAESSITPNYRMGSPFTISTEHQWIHLLMFGRLICSSRDSRSC